MLLTGMDLCTINRFEELKDNESFLKRVYTGDEIKRCENIKNRMKYFALIFCVKEAFAKALKCGLGRELSFTDIEVALNDYKRPGIKFINRDKMILKGLNENGVFLSVGSCREYAAASVIIYREKEGFK